MRVALISDLHGSEVALSAVLASIDRRGVDQVVCLGDVATLGPRPGFVLDTLRARGCPTILGNHDEFLWNPGLVRSYTEAPVIVEAVDWCRDQLSPADLDFVRSFQPTLTLPLDGVNQLFLFHGSPASHLTDLLATTPPDELDRHLAGCNAAVMAGGHTHIQMLRQHRGALLVNPGSVGLAFREYVAGKAPTLMPHAEYAIVESAGGAVSVTLQRVPLDKGALRKAAADSDNPLRGMLIQQYS
ncbi:MAG: metallophosphoesterase family protein [Byssovorax sp.]